MNNNQFSGTIKAGIGNLTRLLWMNLRDNNFSGEVPVELKNLKELGESTQPLHLSDLVSPSSYSTL